MKRAQFFRIAAMVVVICAVPVVSPLAIATPVGNISIANSGSGGVTGSSNLLDFFLPIGGGFGDFITGGGSLTYNNGSGNVTLTGATNTFGQIRDLPAAALPSLTGSTPFANFIAWYAQGTHDISTPGSGTVQTWPRFDLVSVGPPAAVDCATNPGVNV